MIKKLTENRGITLIALVITIIILLILAGVAISMLAGENGIITKTNSAKAENETATVDEQIKLAVMAALAAGNGEIEGVDAFKALNDGLKDAGYNAEIPEDTTWPVDVEIGGDKYTINKDGTIKQETNIDSGELPIIKAGDYASKKSKYVDSNNKIAIIPEGFTVSNVKTDTIDETTINSGLVIYKGDLSAIEDMTTCKTTNDQFVWIPVDDPSTMYGTKDNGEYYGKLYDFTATGATHLNWYDEINDVTDEELNDAIEKYTTDLNQLITQYSQQWDANPDAVKQFAKETYGITIESKEHLEQVVSALYEKQVGPRPTIESLKNKKYEEGHREPDYLMDSSRGDNSIEEEKGLNLLKSIVGIEGTIGIDNENMLEAWKNQLKNEYKDMIDSVKEYKGFYIGRFETSLRILDDGITKVAQSKAGVESASSLSSSANTWYGLYQVEKEYSSKNNIDRIVGSTMIWGSQYDQMMLWLQKNGYNVVSIDPNELKGATRGDNDILNNIYDLLGRNQEWTLEASESYKRIARSGCSGNGNIPSGRKTVSSSAPYSLHLDWSSRVTLYIK